MKPAKAMSIGRCWKKLEEGPQGARRRHVFDVLGKLQFAGPFAPRARLIEAIGTA